MSKVKITTQSLSKALNSKGTVASPQSIQTLCDEYNGYCEHCSNPNEMSTQKLCGCGGNKVKIPPRFDQ
jgi:Zn finger protein HypA/HybF involved in hydrogenase expression